MPDLCDALISAERAHLENAIHGVQFTARDDAAKHLVENGFLEIDANFGALDSVASLAGADLSIRSDVTRKGSRCDLSVSVVDAKHLYVLDELDDHVPCGSPGTTTILSMIKDPKTGIALPVPVEGEAGGPAVHYPICVKCRTPEYTSDARSHGLQGRVRVLITVSAEGGVQNPRVLGAVDGGLAHACASTLSGWTFKPATDADGKPVPMRLLVEVNFRLLPR